MAVCNVKKTTENLTFFYSGHCAGLKNRLVIDVVGGQKVLVIVESKKIPFLDRLIAYLFGAGPAALCNVAQLLIDNNIYNKMFMDMAGDYNGKHMSLKRVSDALFRLPPPPPPPVPLTASALSESKLPLEHPGLFEFAFVKLEEERRNRLMIACASIEGNRILVQLYLNALPKDDKSPLEYKDTKGHTALMHAVVNNHKEIVEELLQAGADPREAIPLAAENDEMMQLLLQAMPK